MKIVVFWITENIRAFDENCQAPECFLSKMTSFWVLENIRASDKNVELLGTLEYPSFWMTKNF